MSDSGGALTRDILLRVRAQNQTTADFKQITAIVNELAGAVDKTTEAAAKGIVKQKELGEQLQQLGKAKDGIRDIRVAIEQWQNLEKPIDNAAAAVDRATKKLEDFRTANPAVASGVGTLGKELAKLEKDEARAQQTLDGLIKRRSDYQVAIEKQGFSTRELAAAEQQLATVEATIATATGALTVSRDHYAEILRKTTEATRAQVAADEAAKKAAEDRAAAERNLAAAIERARAPIVERDRAKAAEDVSAGVAAFKAAEAEKVRAAEEAARKIKEAEEVRIRADAINADLARQRIKAELDWAEKERARANAAEKAAAVENMMVQKRARDENRELTERLDRAQADVRRRMEEEESRRFTSRLRQEGQIQRENARQAVQGLKDRIDGWRNVRTVIGESDKAEEEASQRSSRRASKAKDERQKRPNLIGLEPYQMTNLGYQGVDVLQGILSGTSGGVIAAQQGPQIVQIFGLSVLKWTPIIVAGLASIAVAVGALQRTFREQASTREFQSLLTDNADAVRYSVTQLNELRKAARDMGMSWTEAGAAIRTGIDNNVAQDRLKTLLQMAQDVKDTTGKAVPEAMKEFTSAITGSGEELLKLNDTYKFLSDQELLHTRRQLEAGKTEDARRFIVERLSNTLRDRAKVALDPWTEATRKVSKAWDDLLTTISKTEGFQTANNWLLKIIDSVGGLIKKIDELSSKGGLGKTLLGALVGPNSVVAQAVESIRSTLGLKPLDWSNTPFANEAAARTGGTLATNISGNQKVAADFFASRGYNASQAAAIMGNLQIESSFNPTAVGPFGHEGIAQWDQSRRTALGISKSSTIVQQLEALDAELQKLDPDFKKSTQNVIELTKRFRDVFERPIKDKDKGTAVDINDLAARTRAAQQFYTPPQLTTSATAADAGRTAPVQTGPTPAQTREGQKQTGEAEKQLAIDRAASIEAERQARYAKVTAEISLRDIDDKSKGRLIAIEKQKIDDDLFRARADLEAKREKEKIDNARHYYEITAAGDKAVAEAQARGITGWRELERVRDQAQDKEKDRLARIDQQNDALQQVIKTVDDLKRANDGAYGTDLQKRLEAIDTKYKDIAANIKKARDEATLIDRGKFDEQLAQLPAEQDREKVRATGQALVAQAQAAQSTLNDLVSSYRKQREAGEISIQEEQDKTKAAFEQIQPAIKSATEELEKWYDVAKKAGVPALEIEKVRAKMQEVKTETTYVDPLWKGLVKTAEESFGNRAVEALDSVSEAIGGAIAKTKEWSDVWKSMKTAAANFFAGILKDLASYVIKAELAKLMSSFIPALSGFPGAAASSAATAAASGTASQIGAAGASTGLSSGWASVFSGAAAIAHEGGVIGATQFPRRSVPSAWFDNAPRMHNGGLAAGEQTAILQTGEEVLTGDNPRHVRNWGGGAAPDINIRNILVADPELVPSHMASAKGERVIMNTLTRNAATVRQLVR